MKLRKVGIREYVEEEENGGQEWREEGKVEEEKGGEIKRKGGEGQMRKRDKRSREGRRTGYSQITDRLDSSHAKVIVVLL